MNVVQMFRLINIVNLIEEFMKTSSVCVEDAKDRIKRKLKTKVIEITGGKAKV